jgi:plastocyanin
VPAALAVRSRIRDRAKRQGLAAGLPLAAAALAMLAVSCSSSTPSAGATSNAPPSTASGPAGAAKGTPVTAAETEFKITLSRTSFTPGRYTFTARDKGTLQHNLVITGPGVHASIAGLLSPGQSASVTVTLQKGTYEIFCAVPGHKQQGMDLHITVS